MRLKFELSFIEVMLDAMTADSIGGVWIRMGNLRGSSCICECFILSTIFPILQVLGDLHEN